MKKNLTDEDGPYIELMTEVYSDNQPDFTWLKPYEEKTFEQYFMPYKQLGEVKKASKDVLLNLEIEEKSSKNKVELAVYTTSLFENLKIILRTAEDLLFEKKVNVAPEKVYQTEVETEQEIFRAEHILEVFSATGELLLEY
ncbi:MAG: hypothetical protein ACOCQ1_05220 [Halanaerobiaceae bacterium]